MLSSKRLFLCKKLFCASSKFRFLSFSYQFNEITNCYRLPTKLREGNVFSRVCLSVSSQRGSHVTNADLFKLFHFHPSPTPTYREPFHSKPVLCPPPPPDLIRLVNHPSLCSSPGLNCSSLDLFKRVNMGPFDLFKLVHCRPLQT